jgi:capsular exopolysaccharide synthesis family protein
MDDVSKISLRHLSQVVVRRWRLTLTVALLLFTSLALYVSSLRPEYTAEAVILLAPTGEELGAQTPGRSVAMTDPFFIRSETDIMGSDQLALSVMEKLGLEKLPEFQPHPSRLDLLLQKNSGRQGNAYLSSTEVLRDWVLNKYKDRLSVFNDGRSKTIRLSFSASDPRLAASIANAHAEVYLARQTSRRLDAQQETIAWLAKEATARAEDVREAEARVQQFRLRNGIVSARDTTVVDQRLSELNTQLLSAQLQLTAQTSLLDEIHKVRAGGDVQSARTLSNDENFAEMLRRRAEAEADVASLARRLAPGHPVLQKRTQELASINELLEKQLQRVESAAQRGANSAQSQVDQLSGAVLAETGRKTNQDRAASDLPALEAQAQVKRAVFETVVSRYQTLLAERGFSASSASIESRAIPPASPSFPKTALFLVVAAMAAAFGAVLTAVFAEWVRPSSVGLTAMADAVGVRPLVAITQFKSVSRSNRTIDVDSLKLFIENIRSVRNAILQPRDVRKTTICLVTSALPRQGKSLVAMSLARAIARTGARTLFMDLDLRRSSGNVLAGIPVPEVGMAAVLQGRAAFEDVVVRDDKGTLDMLLAETDSGGAVDRLMTVGATELLPKLSAIYDAIVMDSPPVGVVSDALTFASSATQIILVAKDRETSLSSLSRATRLLRETGASTVGLILTGVSADDMSASDHATVQRYLAQVPSRAAALDFRMPGNAA